MYKFYSRPKTNRFRFPIVLTMGLFLFFLTTVLYPTTKNSVEFRSITKGIRINIHRAAPPFAALEDDLFESQIFDESWSKANSTSTLLAQDNSFGPKIVAQIEQLRSIEDEQINKQHLVDVQKFERFRDVSFEQTKKFWSAVIGSFAPQNTSSEIKESTVVEGSGSTQDVVKKTISLEELNVTKEQLLGQLLAPMIASGNQESGGGKSSPVQSDPKDVPKKTDGSRTYPRRQPPTAQSIEERSFKTAEFLTDDQLSLARKNEGIGQATISGTIQLSEGAALTDPRHQFYVFREIDGAFFETGFVDYRTGKFQLVVNMLKGDVVAVLAGDNNEILAEGRIDIRSLSQRVSRKGSVENVVISLAPKKSGIYGQVVSGYSTAEISVNAGPLSIGGIGKRENFGRTNKLGLFESKMTEDGSRLLIRTHKKGYQSTLSFVSTGGSNKVIAYPEKMVASLYDIVFGERGAPILLNHGTIWGRVTASGAPVAGAKVELATRSPNAKVVYFNKLLLPDQKLTATSENGIYAIVAVDSNVHALVANGTNRTTDPTMILVESGAVSHVDLETKLVNQIETHIFDAFVPEKKIKASIVALGSSDSQEIMGEDVHVLPLGSSLYVADATGTNEYAVIRRVISRDQRHLNFPMVQKDWLSELLKYQKIEPLEDRGAVLGMHQGSCKYDVQVDGESPGEKSFQVTYLNYKQKIFGREFGFGAGYYLISNLSEGFHNIQVRCHEKGTLSQQVVLVDRSVLNIVYSKFSSQMK